MKRKSIIVAGGTGGHINGALALGEYLELNKWDISYLTGTRHLDYKLYKNQNVQHLKTFPLRYKNPFKILKSVLFNSYYFIKLLFQFLFKRPSFILGCGGYVCGPALLAGFIVGIPVYIVEQNAVMGLTNKILCSLSKKIFVHFKDTKGIKDSQKNKIIVSGNPTRRSIKYTLKQKGDEFNILVFGGSLGAKQVNEIIKEIAQLGWEFKLSIVHQVGKNNLMEVISGKNVKYSQKEYIDDMQIEYNKADLVIARAGASTISELRIIQKPTILIPYPSATDNHQFYNAQNLKNEATFYVELLGQDDSLKDNTLKLKRSINELANAENKGSNAPITIPDSAEVIINEIESDIT